MATGLGFYALAGGLAGAGKGLVEEARQDFEMMQDELRAKRAADAAEKDRGFRREESQADRTLRTSESAADRAQRLELQQLGDDRADKRVARSDANAAARSQADAERYSDTFTGGDGFIYERPKGGGQARKIVGDDGQPVKAPPSAAVKDPTKLTAAERAKAITDAMKAATVDDMATGGQVFDQKIYDRIISQIPGLRDAPPPPVSPAPAADAAGLLDFAKDALRRGAPRDKVEARLREQGIDPKLLGE